MELMVKTAILVFMLLNPFLVIIYLADIVQRLDSGQFTRVLIRAGVIASGVFCGFVILGDLVFSSLVQAEFASFQIFGGIVFLLIGIQFVFKGPGAIEILRGESAHLTGAIAMPVLIGPGTISASVLAGERHNPVIGCALVIVSVMISLIIMVGLKKLHDHVRPTQEKLIQRYIEIAGRITALFVGTVSVEMIMQGVSVWVTKISS